MFNLTFILLSLFLSLSFLISYDLVMELIEAEVCNTVIAGVAKGLIWAEQSESFMGHKAEGFHVDTWKETLDPTLLHIVHRLPCRACSVVFSFVFSFF